ncbi:MAG TPA: hypothetical protein VJG83_02345 [archaeon]|nr:hypothetical protein [archaeon]
MVKKIGKYFKCESCGLKYADAKTAEKCETWCTVHNSCNLEITRHAIIRIGTK